MSILILCLALATQGPPVTYPAGVYTVTTPGPTTITYDANSVTFSWVVTPTPPPPVPVPPAPTPPPVPVLTGHVWALAIYDPAVKLPAAQQAALTSTTLQASSLLMDINFQAHPNTDPGMSAWLKQAPGSLPMLLFVQESASGTGILGYSVALPASEADIVAIENKVRGK